MRGNAKKLFTRNVKPLPIVFAKRYYTTDMFCFQCEQTVLGKGCTKIGVCGKTPETAALQDLLVFKMRRLSLYIHECLKNGVPPQHILPFHEFMITHVYATLTNVNFDPERFRKMLVEADKILERAKAFYESQVKDPIKFEFIEKEPNENNTGIKNGWKAKQLDKDIASLHELIMYGIKGAAAYATEAYHQKKWNPESIKIMNECMAFLADAKNSEFADKYNDLDAVLGYALKLGQGNFGIMNDLNIGNKERFGVPSPTVVRTSPVEGKCILVSGHDFTVLEEILKQTEGTGIKVYTHGEMLPAHGYPGLRKYKHLAGNYGSAWQLQRAEFDAFKGPIVVTTNCILEPKASYKDRLFTTSVVGVSGVKHIENRDFSEVIKMAKETKGFEEKDIESFKKIRPYPLNVGFGHDFILSIAPTIVNAVKKGYIKRFFLIGGCDGTETERSYYKDLARTLPEDTIMLTLGCAKYRINNADYGIVKVPVSKDGETEEKEIIDLPRLLDMGQCNDSFSAIQVALALADVFKTDVNSLPISYALSWFEQKAVAVLLTLLHLGVKNIRLGPRLPEFVPPSALELLNKQFNLCPITEHEKDMDTMMKGQ